MTAERPLYSELTDTQHHTPRTYTVYTPHVRSPDPRPVPASRPPPVGASPRLGPVPCSPSGRCQTASAVVSDVSSSSAAAPLPSRLLCTLIPLRLRGRRSRARLPRRGQRHCVVSPHLPGGGGDTIQCRRPRPGSRERDRRRQSQRTTESGREDETAVGPRPKKARRGGRAPRPSHNYRDATRRKDREVGEDAPE